MVNNIANIDISFSVPISSFSVFYLLLGKYLYDETPRMMQNKLKCVCVMIIFTALILIINYFVYGGGVYLGYNSPLIATVAAIIFILFKGVNIENKGLLWKLDRLCFGGYLIHPLFINFAYKLLKATPLDAKRMHLFATIGYWLIFVICSFEASWVMSLIKPLKKWIL